VRVGSECIYPGKDASSFDLASLTILDRLAVIETLLHDLPSAFPAPVLHVPSDNGNGNQTHDFQTPFPLASVTADTFSWCVNFSPASRIGADAVTSWPILRDALSQLEPRIFIDENGKKHTTYLDSWSQSLVPSASDTITPLSRFSTEQNDIERLIDRFFKHVHTKNPILERGTVRQYCLDFYEHGPMWTVSTCLIFLICALGAIADPWSAPKNQDDAGDLALASSYFLAAQKRLGFAMAQPSNLSIQCLCLTGIYYMYILEPLPAYNMFHAAGTIFQIHLSTKAAWSTEDPRSTPHIIQRLFWTCFKSEWELLLELPLGKLSLSNFQLLEQYPTPPADGNDEGRESDWHHIEKNSWYYYLGEIALRKLCDRIVGTLYTGQTSTDPAENWKNMQAIIPTVLEFQRQLTSWHESLPPAMGFPLSDTPLDDELRHHLRSRYLFVSEILYRPFVCSAIHSPSGVPMSSEISSLVGTGLEIASTHLRLVRLEHRHHGTWFQLRYNLSTACIMLAASTRGLHMPDGWQLSIQRIFSELQFWTSRLPHLGLYIEILSSVERWSKKSDVHMTASSEVNSANVWNPSEVIPKFGGAHPPLPAR
jgi:hypothetical protein